MWLYLKDDKNLKISSIKKRHIGLHYITLVVAKTRRKIINIFLSDVKKNSLETFRFFSSTTLPSASLNVPQIVLRGSLLDTEDNLDLLNIVCTFNLRRDIGVRVHTPSPKYHSSDMVWKYNFYQQLLSQMTTVISVCLTN